MSDIYALILYELYTSTIPFRQLKQYEIISIVKGLRPELTSSITSNIVTIITKNYNINDRLSVQQTLQHLTQSCLSKYEVCEHPILLENMVENKYDSHDDTKLVSQV